MQNSLGNFQNNIWKFTRISYLGLEIKLKFKFSLTLINDMSFDAQIGFLIVPMVLRGDLLLKTSLP